MPVWVVTFECLDTGTSFLALQYILTICRLSFNIRVLGQGKGHLGKMGYYDCWTPNSLAMTNLRCYCGHQCKGHLKSRSRVRIQNSRIELCLESCHQASVSIEKKTVFLLTVICGVVESFEMNAYADGD